MKNDPRPATGAKEARHLLRRWGLWAFSLLVLLAAPARAACNWDVAFSPAFPTTISATQTVGAYIYQGSVTYTATGCTFSVNTANPSIYFGWPLSPGAIPGMTGIAALSGIPTLLSNPPNIIFIFYTPGTRATVTYNTTVTAGQVANFQARVNLSLQATATTVTGSLPSPMVPGIVLSSVSTAGASAACGWGWASLSSAFMQCDTYSISGFTGTTVVSNTCAVSTPSVSVALPSVPQASLAAAGATAGLTPFTIGFTGCSASTAGFGATQTWAFTPGPASNVISNAGTASNVYAQILNSAMTPITNGGTTSFTVPAAGGALTQQFYARYYSAGSGGAGSLSSTATFTMTYL